MIIQNDQCLHQALVPTTPMTDIIIIIIVIIIMIIQNDQCLHQAPVPTTPRWWRLPDGSDAHQGGPTQPASGFQRSVLQI